MPRVPLHALIWSSDQGLYELYTQGQFQQCFQTADEAARLTWLREATSFAFHGEASSLNVYRETRPRGGRYWYAYHTTRSRTRKRYLGTMPPSWVKMPRFPLSEQPVLQCLHLSWMAPRAIRLCISPQRCLQTLSPMPSIALWKVRRTRSRHRCLLPCWRNSSLLPISKEKFGD